MLNVGGYLLEAKLGTGGMGEVWLGYHPAIGKKVAIKILNDDFVNDTKTLIRFQREGRVVNKIQHKNIVDIFYFGELEDGRPYIVMEYLKGESLAGYLKKGPLEQEELLHIFGQICQALGAAHKEGVIHRDLKPENVFLVQEAGQRPFVKLLDFGIAKLLGPEAGAEPALTHAGTPMGTPAYMPPEQCKGETIDHRADLYSLGIMLFEALTGRVPFGGPGQESNALLLLVNHTMTPPPSPSSVAQGRQIPPAVDALVLRLLAKEPSQRPSSCEEVYQELVRALGAADDEDGYTSPDVSSTCAGDAAAHDARDEELPSFSGSSSADEASEDGYTSPDAAPPSALRGKKAAAARGALSPKEPREVRPWAALLLGAAAPVLLVAALGLGYWLVSSEREPQSARAAPPAQPAPQGAALPPSPTRPRTVLLSIISSPPGAKVTLGKTPLGLTPLQQELPYGEAELQLELEKDGYIPWGERFIPKEARRFEAILQPEPKAPPKPSEKPRPTRKDTPVPDDDDAVISPD